MKKCIVCGKKSANACGKCGLPICSPECMKTSWDEGAPHRTHCKIVADAGRAKMEAANAHLKKYVDLVVESRGEEPTIELEIGMPKRDKPKKPPTSKEEEEKRMRRLRKMIDEDLERKHHRWLSKKKTERKTAGLRSNEPPKKVAKYAKVESDELKNASERLDDALESFRDAAALVHRETATTTTAPPPPAPSIVDLSPAVAANAVPLVAISRLPYNPMLEVLSLASVDARSPGDFFRETIWPMASVLINAAPLEGESKYTVSQVMRDVHYMGTVVVDNLAAAEWPTRSGDLEIAEKFNLTDATIVFSDVTTAAHTLWDMLRAFADDLGVRAFRFTRTSFHSWDLTRAPVFKGSYEITIEDSVGEHLLERFETVDHLGWIKATMRKGSEKKQVADLLEFLERRKPRVLDVDFGPRDVYLRSHTVDFFKSLMANASTWRSCLRNVVVAIEASLPPAYSWDDLKSLNPAFDRIQLNRLEIVMTSIEPTSALNSAAARFFSASRLEISVRTPAQLNECLTMLTPAATELTVHYAVDATAPDETAIWDDPRRDAISVDVLNFIEGVGLDRLTVLSIPTLSTPAQWIRIAEVAQNLEVFSAEYVCDPPPQFKLPTTLLWFATDAANSMSGIASALGPRVEGLTVWGIKNRVEADGFAGVALPQLKHLWMNTFVDDDERRFVPESLHVQRVKKHPIDPNFRIEYLLSTIRACPRLSELGFGASLRYLEAVNPTQKISIPVPAVVSLCANHLAGGFPGPRRMMVGDHEMFAPLTCLVAMLACRQGGIATSQMTSSSIKPSLIWRLSSMDILFQIWNRLLELTKRPGRLAAAPVCRARELHLVNWRQITETATIVDTIDALASIDLRPLKKVFFEYDTWIHQFQHAASPVAVIAAAILALRPNDGGKIIFYAEGDMGISPMANESMRNVLSDSAPPELKGLVAEHAYAQLKFDADKGWYEMLTGAERDRVTKIYERIEKIRAEPQASEPPSKAEPPPK